MYKSKDWWVTREVRSGRRPQGTVEYEATEKGKKGTSSGQRIGSPSCSSCQDGKWSTYFCSLDSGSLKQGQHVLGYTRPPWIWVSPERRAHRELLRALSSSACPPRMHLLRGCAAVLGIPGAPLSGGSKVPVLRGKDSRVTLTANIVLRMLSSKRLFSFSPPVKTLGQGLFLQGSERPQQTQERHLLRLSKTIQDRVPRGKPQLSTLECGWAL